MDLDELLGSGNQMPPAPKELVDKSDKPRPTRAIVVLPNGIQVDATLKFTGTVPQFTRAKPERDMRRYKVMVELDWDTVKVDKILVDRWPGDVLISLGVPDDLPDDRCREIARAIEFGLIDGGSVGHLHMTRTHDNQIREM